MSDYDHVQKGSLKLKTPMSSESSVKKKKKKKKKQSDELKQLQAQEVKTGSQSVERATSSKSHADKKTKAELAFQKVKEERMVKEISTKVSKSHKERIMEFNEYLDNLSEHYDIPKVSWTK